MSAPNKNMMAILGFLSWKPMSGYDIKNLVDVSLAWFWSISYGQIYPILSRLLKAGYAEIDEDAGVGARTRKIYSITRSGEDALDAWISEPMDPSPQRDEMQLRLFLGGTRSPKAIAESIRRYRDHMEERLSRLAEEQKALEESLETGRFPDNESWLEPENLSDEERRDQVRRQSRIFLLTVRQGVLKAQARVTWCDEALEVFG